MSLRSLVVLALRFKAATGIIYGIISLANGYSEWLALRTLPSPQPATASFFLTMAGAGILANIVLWFLVEPISRLIVRGQPAEVAVNISGLTRQDLYAAAMVLMGVMFVGDSLHQIMSWIAYNFNPELWRYYHEDSYERTVTALIGNAVPFIVGLLLIWKANAWSSWLVKREAK